jgi:hypothetical protein
LAPLAPVASKLAAVPDKITTLQSATFESGEQVRALNLALYRVKAEHREGKAPPPKTGQEPARGATVPPRATAARPLAHGGRRRQRLPLPPARPSRVPDLRRQGRPTSVA